MSNFADNKAWEALMAKSREFVVAAYRERDQKMIGVIEAIEGRVPTNEEIAEHGAYAVHRDGHEEWKWRGKTICITSAGWPAYGELHIFQ